MYALLTEGLKNHTEPPMHAAQAAIRQMGFNYGIQQDAAPVPVAAPQACRSSFGGWCLDKSALSKGAVIGIIAGGSAAILAGIVLAIYLAVRRAPYIPPSAATIPVHGTCQMQIQSGQSDNMTTQGHAQPRCQAWSIMQSV